MIKLSTLIGILPILLLVAAIVALLLSGYVKAPPDQAYIISGIKQKPRILIGRAGIKIPFFERLDRLYLGQMTVDIKTDTYIPTNDFINVRVDAVAKVRIKPTEDGIGLAAKNFLNKNAQSITNDLQDSLQGNMREIIGTLDLKSINTDRDQFSDQVMQKASRDMDKLGIEILSCNIQNVTDENGLITDLGMDNTAKIKKDAAIAKAQADRDVAIAQAEANRAANEARVLSETEIAQKNNELDIKKAELKTVSDTAKAQADAAYEIQKQEQEKTIQAATVKAQIAKAEQDAELNKQIVEVEQQKLTAEINKKADAERYRVEQEAAAELAKRQKDADAKKYEQEKEAEAQKAIADANKYAMLQEAEGIRAKGEAEAAAIQAKGIAEAEAMEKKADAMKKYGQAAMMEMIVQALPDMARAIAEPLSTIDKVTIIDSGNGDSGVGSIGGYVPSVLSKTIETIKETTGLDLVEVMKAETYDAKVTKNINFTGLEQADEAVKTAASAASTAEISESLTNERVETKGKTK